MTSKFYVSKANTASRLIAKFGQPIIITQRDVAGAYDPETGTVGGTPVVMNGTGIEVDMSADDALPDGLIRSEVRKYMLSVSGIQTPQLRSVFTTDGQDFTIVHLRVVAPGGVHLYYEVFVKT